MSDDTRDRVIGLERDVKHLTALVEKWASQQDEMYVAFQKGRGAAWVLWGAWSVLVGVVSANARFIWQSITGGHA